MKDHVCPWWVGYILLIPFRRFPHNPGKILGPHVREGMTVLDVGPGMGFFSLPLARMVGETGKVICVDIQEKMIRVLRRRAERAHLSGRIETRICRKDSLLIDDLAGKIDFALLFAVAHEIPDRDRLFMEIHRTMKQGKKLLMAEPKLHVKKQDFEESVLIACRNDFDLIDHPNIRRTYSATLRKEDS